MTEVNLYFFPLITKLRDLLYFFGNFLANQLNRSLQLEIKY
jgi:hypothetical protein